MGIRRTMTIGGLLPASLWIWAAVTPGPGSSAEYYSWIDSSGTLVLTDDLSGLPPAMPPASVWTHKFRDRPETATSEPSHADNSKAESDRNEPVPAGETARTAPPAAAEVRADLQGQMEQASQPLASGQVLTLGVPLLGSSRPRQSFPFGSMLIPPGPDGLQQRLRELQALQASSFSHLPLPHAKPGPRQIVAGPGHGHR